MVNILRLPQVQARTGLSKTAIYLRMKRGTFPKPIALGNSRARGWIESEIDALIEEDIRRSREPVETRGAPSRRGKADSRPRLDPMTPEQPA